LINQSLETHKYISRKAFLRLTALAFTAAFIALWYLITGKQKQLEERPVVRKINISGLGNGIYLYDRFIINKSADKLHVFSNRCTHAGCNINQEINGELVCPCHGSRFEASTGKVLQGPAGLPLHVIPHIFNTKTGEITIKL